MASDSVETLSTGFHVDSALDPRWQSLLVIGIHHKNIFADWSCVTETTSVQPCTDARHRHKTGIFPWEIEDISMINWIHVNHDNSFSPFKFPHEFFTSKHSKNSVAENHLPFGLNNTHKNSIKNSSIIKSYSTRTTWTLPNNYITLSTTSFQDQFHLQSLSDKFLLQTTQWNPSCFVCF